MRKQNQDRARIISESIERVVNKILTEQRGYGGSYIKITNISLLSGQIARIMNDPENYNHVIIALTVYALLIEEHEESGVMIVLYLDPAVLSYIFSLTSRPEGLIDNYIMEIMGLPSPVYNYIQGNAREIKILRTEKSVYYQQPLENIVSHLYNPLRGTWTYSIIKRHLDHTRHYNLFLNMPTPQGFMRIAAFLEQGSSGGVVRVCDRCMLFSSFCTVSSSTWFRSVHPPVAVYPVMASESRNATLLFVGEPGMMGRSTYDSRLFKDDDTVDISAFLNSMFSRYPEPESMSINDPREHYKKYVEYMKKFDWRRIKIILGGYMMRLKFRGDR